MVEVNGRRAGAGSFATDYAEGESLSVTVQRPGFQPWTGTFAVGPDPVLIAADLEPAPVIGRFATDAQNPTNTASGPGLTIIADSAGGIHAYDRSGARRFTVATRNTGEEGALPVEADGLIYFSGTRELVIVDAASGRVRARVDLTPEQAQPFGMRPVRVPRGLIFPTQSTLLLLDATTGAELRRHPIPGGTGASPAVYRNNLLIVNRRGELLVVPSDTGEPIDRIETPTRNVTGAAPVLHGSVAVFADVQGTVVAVDVEASRVVWNRSITGRVFADATVTATGAYVVSGTTLHAFALATGGDLFAPIQGVSGLPAEAHGYVFFGTATSRLVAIDGTSGSVVGTVELDAPVRGRVQIEDRVVSVVTERGTLWRVHIDGMVAPR